MSNNALQGKKIAVLATDGFEQTELRVPLDELRSAGAEVHVIAPKDGSIRGWDHDKWGTAVPVDRTIKDADPNAYHALVLPGGVMNPDQLRQDKGAIAFAKSFFKAGKPVSTICHGPQLLINCGVLEGRHVTSYP